MIYRHALIYIASEVSAGDQIRGGSGSQRSVPARPTVSHAVPREPVFPLTSAWGDFHYDPPVQLSRHLCRPLPTMPSIRVKTSRSFYKTLDEEAPTSPALTNRRPRSKSVIEVFSGSPFLQSPDPQSPQPQSYAPNLGGARLSRVSQQISRSSGEALPGPSTHPQYRGSYFSQDGTGTWDEDQTEAVIDHLDVIGAETLHLLRRLAESLNHPPPRPPGCHCIEPYKCCKLYRYVCRDTRVWGVQLTYPQTTNVALFPETDGYPATSRPQIPFAP